MASRSISSKVNVRQCSRCQGDTEYHCSTCDQNLCPRCKGIHTISLDTKDHNVTLYREKFKSSYKREMCVKHPDQLYEMFCELSALPVCFHCTEDSQQELRNVKAAYEMKRKQNEEIISSIRSDKLYIAPIVSSKLIKTIINCDKLEVFSRLNFSMLKKAQKLKESLDIAFNDRKHLTHVDRCLIEWIEIRRHLIKMQKYEHSFEQSANKPAQFLRFIKKVHQDGLIKLLKPGKHKLQIGNDDLFSLTFLPMLQKYLADVCDCKHISYLTSDLVWISDKNNITLRDTAIGSKLHSVLHSCVTWGGIHTVNNKGEFIYIENNSNINKIFSERKTPTTFITNTDSKWEPMCVYCSPSSGDLLVGMCGRHTHVGKVMRYNNAGILTQTIPEGKIPLPLYSDPRYITENNNGDVVVSDTWPGKAVVVTSYEGKHRFSYRGPPSGSELDPYGVCTDVLSHILVCDNATDTVQMLNKDGEFLSYLLTREAVTNPRSLSYDMNTHRLWVVSSNKVCVYRYLDRQLGFAGKSRDLFRYTL